MTEPLRFEAATAEQAPADEATTRKQRSSEAGGRRDMRRAQWRSRPPAYFQEMLDTVKAARMFVVAELGPLSFVLREEEPEAPAGAAEEPMQVLPRRGYDD